MQLDKGDYTKDLQIAYFCPNKSFEPFICLDLRLSHQSQKSRVWPSPRRKDKTSFNMYILPWFFFHGFQELWGQFGNYQPQSGNNQPVSVFWDNLQETSFLHHSNSLKRLPSCVIQILYLLVCILFGKEKFLIVTLLLQTEVMNTDLSADWTKLPTCSPTVSGTCPLWAITSSSIKSNSSCNCPPTLTECWPLSPDPASGRILEIPAIPFPMQVWILHSLPSFTLALLILIPWFNSGWELHKLGTFAGLLSFATTSVDIVSCQARPALVFPTIFWISSLMKKIANSSSQASYYHPNPSLQKE